jgi:protein-disulfide isomerase
VTDAERINLAVDTKLDANKLTECITTGRYLPQVRAEIAEGETIGVSGTPSVFIDGKKIDLSVFRSTEILRNWLDQYLGLKAPTASGVTK